MTPAPLDLQTYLESGPNIGDVFTPVAYGYFNEIGAYIGISVISPDYATSSSGNHDSPEFLFTGDYWSGANQLDTWSILSEIGTGATPTTTLVFGHSGSPGTASVNIPYPLTVTSCTGCGGSGGNYVNLGSAVTWSGCTYSAGICTITGSNTITISAIPGTYLNLKINLNGTQANANPQYTLLTINGVTSNGTYDYGWITGGAGVGITNGGDNGKTDMYVCPLTQSAVSLETGVGGGEITIFNYASTTVSKMLNYQCTMATSTGSYPNLVTWNGNGVSRPTTAVTSITFYTPYGDNMVGTISIYGTN